MLKVAVGVIFVLSIVGASVYFWRRGGWEKKHQKVIAYLVIGFGMYLAVLTGSATRLVLPGLGSIGLGATAGAGVGAVTYLLLGGIGLATGGTAYAVGLGWLVLVGGGLGAFSGSAAGFGLKTVSYPLVQWYLWVPILLLGCYLWWNSNRKPVQQKLSDRE
ncbi:MAG: hypothetical protein EOO23_00900 [Comamonadaceae bacterium]|nr:MAG: hypothetical protein EOO23_00900 [Comamonadaceae bacterium]